MSTDFYFHSLKVENFRSFKALQFDKFRRINIVGGFNGVGKSALLETLFLVLDRRHPVALLKPLFFRRFETTAPIDPLQFLQDSDVHSARIEWSTKHHKQRMEMKYELKPANFSVTLEGSSGLTPPLSHMGGANAFGAQKGLSIKIYEGHSQIDEESAFAMAAPNGLSGTLLKSSQKEIPKAQFISTATRQSSRELAQVLSIVIRNSRLEELVEYLKVLHPSLSSLLTLQEGEEVQVYAKLDNGKLLPIQYMGDGFQNLLHTLCAVINCAGGVILLDEIDAAMHYSIITDVWKIIAGAAAKENCQIIATTHSRECINSAALGIEQAGKKSDFQYVRLEKVDGRHRPIFYSMEELADAETFNVEIR
jgi:predicted ATP-dependent endonuclease of OLD family